MRLCISCATVAVVAGLSMAHADPITPTYTVTDLGSLPAYWNLGSVQPGNSVVIGPNGLTYAFPQSFLGQSISTPANFPLLDTVPAKILPYDRTSSTAVGVVLYPNGVAIANDNVEMSSQAGAQSSWQRNDPYYTQQNSNGSWSQPVELLQGQGSQGTFPAPLSLAMLSKTGDVLELYTQESNNLAGIANIVSIYNVYSHAYTDVTTLPAIANNGFSYLIPIGIDDQGTALMWALHYDPSQSGPVTEDLLLITPSGVSPDPIATPEPGSWAVMALAIAGFAAYSKRQARKL